MQDAVPAVMTNCGHATGCTGCFMGWVQNKIKEKDVTPWINWSATHSYYFIVSRLMLRVDR